MPCFPLTHTLEEFGDGDSGSYFLINVFVVFSCGLLGVVRRGGRRGEDSEKTAGVLLLAVNELLHEALPLRMKHIEISVSQELEWEAAFWSPRSSVENHKNQDVSYQGR